MKSGYAWCLPFLRKMSSDVRKALASIEFDEIQLPKLSEKISERIDELRSDLAEYRQKVDGCGRKGETPRPWVIGSAKADALCSF